MPLCVLCHSFINPPQSMTSLQGVDEKRPSRARASASVPTEVIQRKRGRGRVRSSRSRSPDNTRAGRSRSRSRSPRSLKLYAAKLKAALQFATRAFDDAVMWNSDLEEGFQNAGICHTCHEELTPSGCKCATKVDPGLCTECEPIGPNNPSPNYGCQICKGTGRTDQVHAVRRLCTMCDNKRCQHHSGSTCSNHCDFCPAVIGMKCVSCKANRLSSADVERSKRDVETRKWCQTCWWFADDLCIECGKTPCTAHVHLPWVAEARCPAHCKCSMKKSTVDKFSATAAASP